MTLGRVVLLVICMICLPWTATASAGERPPTIADFGWLAGCWEGGGEGREYLEQWMRPAGGATFGMSRTVADGKTVAHEFMQIREQRGEIHFIAKPSGQEEASFKLVRHGPQEATFENPEHDFPQRVIYRPAPDGRLAAAIEGLSNGQLKRIDFPMRRADCD